MVFNMKQLEIAKKCSQQEENVIPLIEALSLWRIRFQVYKSYSYQQFDSVIQIACLFILFP